MVIKYESRIPIKLLHRFCIEVEKVGRFCRSRNVTELQNGDIKSTKHESSLLTVVSKTIKSIFGKEMPAWRCRENLEEK